MDMNKQYRIYATVIFLTFSPCLFSTDNSDNYKQIAESYLNSTVVVVPHETDITMSDAEYDNWLVVTDHNYDRAQRYLEPYKASGLLRETPYIALPEHTEKEEFRLQDLLSATQDTKQQELIVKAVVAYKFKQRKILTYIPDKRGLTAQPLIWDDSKNEIAAILKHFQR
jgi:hypothetical protein